ncbi:multidrug export protein EmrA [mine drainage metagenome]|uniref:Multidrug export protein EmrA n=1 Tax=mine drainage metagenome TaxID=410659 RepID=A0A1J5PXZ9_9ZZZZ
MTRLAAVVAVAGLGWIAYEYLIASHVESTDNAYVQGDVIQITPQQGGTVLAVMANETDAVKAGETLVRLDPADAGVALDQARAALAQAVRQARTLYANNATLNAQVALHETDVVKARNALERSQGDLQRRQSLNGNGAVSQEELKHAQEQFDSAKSTLDAAQAGVLAAREQLASNQVLTEGARVEQQPGVLLAAARLREAFLATERTQLLSPVDGYVAKRTVQIGQRVAAGMPLMSVVALNHLWVEANFKEVQLRNIRIGQPVKLVADQYGTKVSYSGSVIGLGAGTGAAFSLLPAQNATGNWIKVVQRVPVRIGLDAAQLAAHPLRVGLSMTADVDISNTGGPTLALTPAADATVLPAALRDEAADKLVQQVIAANLGHPVPQAAH